MSEKRVVRQYEVEFKLDAVRLVEEQGYSVPEAAQRLGILKSNLSNWHRQYRKGADAWISAGAADARGS
jgi:transposase